MISTRKTLSIIAIAILLVMPLSIVKAQSTPAPSGTPLGGNTSGTPLGGNTSGTPLGGNTSGTPLGGNTAPAGTTGTGLTNPLNATDLVSLLKEVLTYAVQLGTIFLTIMLVYVGFLFVAARGNDEKLKSARSALVWTVVGGILLLGASALASDIATTVSGL